MASEKTSGLSATLIGMRLDRLKSPDVTLGAIHPSENDFSSIDAMEGFYSKGRLYLETSSLNHFAEKFSIDDLMVTKKLQENQGAIFLGSETLIWEILLNQDPKKADHLLMVTQALCYRRLLASPSELMVRYLNDAYPENTVNYPVFANSKIGDIWASISDDFSRNMQFDFSDLFERTKLIRRASKGFASIVEDRSTNSDELESIRMAVNVIISEMTCEIESLEVADQIARSVALVVFLWLDIGVGLDQTELRSFWQKHGLLEAPLFERSVLILKRFPEVFVRGPILELAIMAFTQMNSGKTNRGSLHDGMHLVYSPYVDAILTNDSGFADIKTSFSHYEFKILHIDQVLIQSVAAPEI